MEKGILFIVGAIIIGTMPFWIDSLLFPAFIYYIGAIALIVIGISALKHKKSPLRKRKPE